MSLSHRYNIRHTLLASPRLLTYKEDTNTSGGRTSSEKSTIRKWSISGYVCLWQSKEVRYCLIQSETRVRNSFSYPICYFTVLWMSNEKYDRLFRQNQDWIKIGCKIDAQAASCTINAPLDSSTGSDLGFIMIPGAQVRTTCSSKKNNNENFLRFLDSSTRLWSPRSRGSCRESVCGRGSPPAGLATSPTRSRSPAPWTTAWARRTSRACTATSTWPGTAWAASCWRPGLRTTLTAQQVFIEAYYKEGAIGIANNVLQGIVLLGSYLPDLFGSHENVFQVPVLTAVGELDGLTISFVFRLSLFSWSKERFSFNNFFDREWKESQEAEDLIGMPGRFPVHVINDANHGQVWLPTVTCTDPFSPLCLANLEVFPFFDRRWQAVRSQPLLPARTSLLRSRSRRHDARFSNK